MNLKPGKIAVRVTNRNFFLNLREFDVRWAVMCDGKTIQDGVLAPIDCAPGKQVDVKISADPPQAGECWLRVSFHTRRDELWAKAGHEIAWEQVRLETRSPAPKSMKGDLPPLKMIESGDAVKDQGRISPPNSAAQLGTLTSLAYDGREILVAGPVLQIFRAPTDNDKGFGRWLARDWRQAGLDHLERQRKFL